MHTSVNNQICIIKSTLMIWGHFTQERHLKQTNYMSLKDKLT